MKNRQLDGARAKIERANYHLSQIDVAIGKVWADERQNASAALPCYKIEGQEIIVFRPHSTPVDPSVSLIVGDFIHNIRSSLDHMLFQLAVLNHASTDAATHLSFPICLKQPIFQDITKSKIAKFISSAALAEIEKLQPYSTGKGEMDILWILSQLDIIDKHRLLIVTKSKIRPTGFTVTTPDGQEAIAYLPPGQWKASEAGTELIRFNLSGSVLPPGEVKVQIQTAMTVQIEKSGLACDGTPIQEVLSDCAQYAINIIDLFGRMFFLE